MANAFDHCEALARDGDKDRFLATLFAPEKYRRALFALYAFNLEIARVREAAREPMPGEIRLQWWRDALAGAGWGEVSANPVAAALREAILRYRLPTAELIALIDAREFDLYDDPMPSVGALENYAAATSGTMFSLAVRILNDGRDPGVPELLSHLGIAQGVTALMRALPIHVGRRQLYVPADVMARHGAQAEDVFAGRTTAALSGALGEMRILARSHLTSARALLDGAPAAITPALLTAVLIRPALMRLERRSPFAPGDVPQWRRQWRLWRAARAGLAKYL